MLRQSTLMQRFGLAAFVACTSFSDVQARTWRVRADFTGEVPTIPVALDSARAGDEILLGAGVYSWSTQGHDAHPSDPSMLRITRAVTLRGESSPAATVLDAEGQGRVLRCIDAGALRVENLTLTGGVSVGAGAGMLSEGDSRPLLVGCIVRDNHSGERAPGGGVSCADGEVRDCEFRNNVTGVAGFGGGLHCKSTLVAGCSFVGNVSIGGDAGGGAGGGLWSDLGTVVDCAFDSNRVEGVFTTAGGGMYEAGLGTITDCVFVGNVARSSMNQGFGAGVYTFSSAAIDGCVFISNVAEGAAGSGLGGGVYGRRETTLTRCTLLGNSSGVHTDVSVTVEASILAWNTDAACTGGATWTCSNLYGNGGGDVVCGPSAGGNFSAPPEFCAIDPINSRNVLLQADSPCAVGNHPQGAPCGPIGAATVGCERVTATRATWGHIKSLFR